MTDWDRLREDFPILEGTVYLKTAAVGPCPSPAVQAGLEFDRRRNELDADRLPEWLRMTEEVRGTTAAFLGAHPDEIAFTTCTTDGIHILAWGLDLGPGDLVLTDELDFPGNAAAWTAAAEARGFQVAVVPSIGAALGDFAGRNLRVISVSWVSWRNGFTHDLNALAERAHRRGALLVVDAIQGVGAFAADLRSLAVDALTFGTYKWLMGPLGLGVLFVRRSVLDRIHPARRGWMQDEGPEHRRGARRFEYATLNFRGLAEFGAALRYLAAIGPEAIEARIRRLVGRFRAALEEAGRKILCARKPQGTILAYEEPQSFEIERKCQARRILLRARPGVIKISPHFLTAEDELERVLEALLKSS